MAYNRDDAIKAGEALAKLVKGALNGIQMSEEIPNVMNLMSALAAASDELQDKDAAALHVGSGFMGALGDDRVDPQP